jgi:hypothetical protein
VFVLGLPPVGLGAHGQVGRLLGGLKGFQRAGMQLVVERKALRVIGQDCHE